MAHYAVGDLQGCRTEFGQLLEHIKFGEEDRLWLLGDLINRGADSLGTLQDVMALDDQCDVVLGNHDLHFLAIHFGGHKPSRNDTFDVLLDHPQISDLAEWLCSQKLFMRHKELDYSMTHAGVPHIWSLPQAQDYAAEVELALQDKHPEISRRQFFVELYGNEPDLWQENLTGMPRLRMITNYFTRMRLVDEQGRLEFQHKGAITDAPSGWRPWYEYHASGHFPGKLVFGHWAALDGVTGKDNFLALDTGCVWGRQLTALCLETQERFSVPAV